MAGSMVDIGEADFDQAVAQSSVPVVVDFWAEWCGPCKMLTPVLGELATEYEGKVKVVKVNVDHNQNLAAKFGVQAIPTLLFFKGGQVSEQIAGLKSKTALKASFDRLLE